MLIRMLLGFIVLAFVTLRAVASLTAWHALPLVRRRVGGGLVDYALCSEAGARQVNNAEEAELWKGHAERIAREAGLCLCRINVESEKHP